MNDGLKGRNFLIPLPAGEGFTRRDLIALLGGAAASSVLSPLTAVAQQKLPTIGYLGAGTPVGQAQWLAAFQQRLRELGWIEGKTVAIEYRWAESRPERYAEIAAEFVRLKVDVIATLGIAVPAVKQVTSAIPIVFAMDADPVDGGLVASLARPGGNVTGLSTQTPDTAGKRLDLLREIFPDLRRLAILANVNFHGAMADVRAVEAAAHALAIDIVDRLEIRTRRDIAPAFAARKGDAQVLYVCGDPLVATNRVQIVTLALGARLPTMFVQRQYIDAGGLISYGPDFVDLNRRAADFVDKILRGAKPADIPVEQPTKFELIVNLTTAKALGLKIPEAFLLRADEVIE